VFPLFATGIFDIGGKFAAGINEKIQKITLMLLSKAWGKMIHEKNQKQKIS
jgi:hypothetical protein